MCTAKFAAVLLVALLLAPLLSVSVEAQQEDLSAYAATRMRCLTRDQQRVAIKDRRAVTLATVRRILRSRVPGELVRARLCQEPKRLIYLLTVLPRDGKVRRVTIDARNGAILSVR
jgi:uncharacterized membrane protein YkoI